MEPSGNTLVAAAGPTEETQGRTVLVVDDDEITRDAFAVILRQEGYDVVPAADGREALDCLANEPPPNLILLDMMMPGVDGWRFLQAMRRNPARANVPVIVVTALGVSSAAWAASLGAVGCFRKPVDVPALLDEVRHHCG